MKTEQIKKLEKAIWKATKKQGVFCCFEVTIGWSGKERVDYMTYNTKDEFRCYEIKITKADFHSKCHNSFVGDFNYYVMPIELYEQVKLEIPNDIGVYVSKEYISHQLTALEFVKCIKKAKRRKIVDRETLKNSMIRSLYREVSKQIQSDNPLVIEAKNREISRLRTEREHYYRESWDLRRKLEGVTRDGSRG